MTGVQLWPSLQASGWRDLAQQAAMFLTAPQGAPEVEHTNSSLMNETLALGCGSGLKNISNPDLATRLKRGGAPLPSKRVGNVLREPSHPAGLGFHGNHSSKNQLYL